MIQGILENLQNKGFRVTHVISETNLQPDAQGVSEIFSELGFRHLSFWTLWLPQALAFAGLYQFLKLMQEDMVLSDPVQWHFVHNPHSQVEGRDSSGNFPSMYQCFGLTTKSPPDPNKEFLRLSSNAQRASEQNLGGNDYWECIYRDYLTKGIRPLNLLPIYHRSEKLRQIMDGHFSGLQAPITDPQQLGILLNDMSENMYSDIFASYFQSVGI